MNVVLTEQQIRDLTGYRQHSRQARWIAEQLKIKAPIRADGLPILTMAQLQGAIVTESQDASAGEFTWSKP